MQRAYIDDNVARPINITATTKPTKKGLMHDTTLLVVGTTALTFATADDGSCEDVDFDNSHLLHR